MVVDAWQNGQVDCQVAAVCQVGVGKLFAVEVVLYLCNDDESTCIEVCGTVEFGVEVLTLYFNIQPQDFLADFGHVLLVLIMDV